MKLKSNLYPCLLLVCLGALAACAHTPPPARTFNAERAFMERSLERDPAGNPQLIFVLLGQYSATRQQRAGLSFFEGIMRKGGLEPELRALYLAACGALRAQTADEIALLERIAWVERGIGELDEAVRITQNKMFIVRWLRALVLAPLPDRFDKTDVAMSELQWAEKNIDRAPTPGLLREVLYLQAELYQRRGDVAQAKRYLARSGYRRFGRPVALTTPFVLSKEKGFAFNSRSIEEVIKGRLYQATGYDFMEYYFIVSNGGAELISIDCGSRGDSMRDVLADLRAAHPELPPLTTVLITHAHWDHVGGQRYLRSAKSPPVFWANSEWASQLHHQENTGGPYAKWWGTRFDLAAVTSFRPDKVVAERTTIDVDGTAIELIPIAGGETRDALLIYFPADKTAFGGDFIMPYLGAPFAQEGGAPGLVKAIEVVEALQPERVLHGHEGINRLFPTTRALFGMKEPLRWLEQQTLSLLAQGVSRAQIHHKNLTPSKLLAGKPELDLPYIVIREHLINRVVDQKLGYWQVGFGGADYLTKAELGSILVHYAKLDIDEQAELIADMIEAGDHELALRTVNWLLPHNPKSEALIEMRRHAQLGLVDREQTLDAFKFIWYGGGAGFEAGAPQ